MSEDLLLATARTLRALLTLMTEKVHPVEEYRSLLDGLDGALKPYQGIDREPVNEEGP